MTAHIIRSSAYGLAFALAFASGSLAHGTSDWEFTIAPYLWGASLSGNVGTFEGQPPADVDASFSEIFENLEFGGMIVGNANNGRFGVTVDLQYIDLDAGTNSLKPVFGRTELDVTNTVASLSLEYLVSGSEAHQVWLAAGARYWSVDTDLDIASGLLPGAKVSGDDAWTDPMIGARGSVDLNSRVYLTG
jgi:hypothetical protein